VSGNTVYDYGAIDECNARFDAEINLMHQDIDQFQADVAKLVTETWGGHAADGYNTSADTLNAGLSEKRDVLVQLREKLARAAENTHATDVQGGKDIQQSVS
jgi:uncharacterized protein YukE